MGRLELRIGSRDRQRAFIEVSDNGVGIPRENLITIFSHGFTTKEGGHGFGLHSCANIVKELGGTLRVHSDGIGRGPGDRAGEALFGAVDLLRGSPVPFSEYVASVAAQSVNNERITAPCLLAALKDLSLSEEMLSRLGQAMTAGRALFLFGKPGNGKTSIAERLTAAFGSEIWIPRAISAAAT